MAQNVQKYVAELVETHGDQLRRFLIARTRKPEEVPDIVQEIYLRMLRVPDFESIRSPEAYLFTVARHVLQQHSLKQSTIPNTSELAELLRPPAAASDSDPVLQLDAELCLQTLQATLDELSPKVRATFLLHRRDGLSVDEIAAALGTTRPMVKKYLVRALMRFREQLARDE